VIRYSKLGYVELNVSHLERSKAFYEEIVGIEYVGEGYGGFGSLSLRRDHHSVVLHQKDPPVFAASAWILENKRSSTFFTANWADHEIPFEELSHEECAAEYSARDADGRATHTGDH